MGEGEGGATDVCMFFHSFVCVAVAVNVSLLGY